MWPLPKIDNEWVSIAYNPTSITCCWIQKTDNAPAPYTLAAYQHTPLNNLELASLIPYNRTALISIIRAFLTKYSVSHAYVSCALTGPTVFENIVQVPTASPTNTDIINTIRAIETSRLKKMNIEYHYLYPKEDAQSVFYVCGIQQHHLLQHQLLAIAADMNITIMTTEYMALLRLYKQIYGKAFRNSQLAQDMMKHNNMLAQFFTPDIIRRTVHIPPAWQRYVHDMAHLYTVLGLYFIGQDSYDQY